MKKLIGLLLLLCLLSGCDIISDTNDGHFNLVYWTMDVLSGQSPDGDI